MDEKKLSGLLGLALRAGQAKIGTGRALDALRAGKAGLILLDERASDNTRKRFEDSCRFYAVACCVFPPNLIGRSVGKEDTMAVALLKGGMAETLLGLCRGDIIKSE